ncbi:MAG: hypothetical protein LBH75_04625 [Treponema sp.]|jgi:hypothetical protein|nr:hypothetical protein [Treponema sp.]
MFDSGVNYLLDIKSGTQTISNTPIMKDSLSMTEIYHNNLEPADSSIRLTIPWNQNIADFLKTYRNDAINGRVYHRLPSGSNSAIFHGLIEGSYTLTKSQRLEPIAIEITSYSMSLKRNIGKRLNYLNTSIGKILNNLLSGAGCSVAQSYINSFPFATKTLPIFTVEADEEWHETIRTLLFEYGYTFHFTMTSAWDSGVRFIPLFNMPPSDPKNITQVFDGSNIRSQVQVTFEKTEYKNTRVKWNSIAVTPNDRVFFDNTGKEVPANKYFGHESESGAEADIVDKGAVTIEYASKVGEVLHAEVAETAFTVKTTPTGGWTTAKSGTGLGNGGVGFTFKLKNNNSYTAKVEEIKAIGTSYCISAINEENISADTDSVFEYEAAHIHSREDAIALCQNIYNYYQYSNIDLILESYDDFTCGTFVRVTEKGIGTIVARILQKQGGLNRLIHYTLEAVTDFNPGNVSAEKRTVTVDSTLRGTGISAEKTPDAQGNISGGNISAEGNISVQGSITVGGKSVLATGFKNVSFSIADASKTLEFDFPGQWIHLELTGFDSGRYVYLPSKGHYLVIGGSGFDRGASDGYKMDILYTLYNGGETIDIYRAPSEYLILKLD